MGSQPPFGARIARYPTDYQSALAFSHVLYPLGTEACLTVGLELLLAHPMGFTEFRDHQIREGLGSAFTPAGIAFCRRAMVLVTRPPAYLLVQACQPPLACNPITRPRQQFACAIPSFTPSRPSLACGSLLLGFCRSFTPPTYAGRMCNMRESEQKHSRPFGPLVDRDFSSHYAS